MEHPQASGPLLGLYACDADLFARVWERVGAEGCPVTPSPRPDAGETEAPMPAPVAQPVTQAPAPETPVSDSDLSAAEAEAGFPTTPSAAEEGEATDDFPHPDDLPCLGRSSSAHREQLQRYIQEELEGWQLYRHLARRVAGPHAKALAALAGEKHRRARRLAAAHFLIAGVRFWPTDRLAVPRITSWLGTLRERFAAEQRHVHRYRAAACDTADPCLAELYGDLAGECVSHAALLRGILETAL